MAFTGKSGGLFRQTISQNTLSTGQVLVPSMLNPMRCMSTKLFVGGLSYGTYDNQLKEAFSSFGDMIKVRVIVDRESGRSRGFGFVNFTSDEHAESALKAMDGQELQGRNICVSLANERPSYGGGGGGGVSYRGGGGGGGGGYGGDYN